MMHAPSYRPSGNVGRLTHHLGDRNGNVTTAAPVISSTPAAGDLGLPQESAAPLAFRAVVALERHHDPGVQLRAMVGGEANVHLVRWRRLPSTVAPNEDDLTATAEGAMGIALALAARHWKWRVLRRLYSRLAEGADWLMVDESDAQIPFEVGGTDEGDLDALLRRKSVQARASPFARHGRAAACVVRFVDARALLWRSDDEPR